MILTLNKFIEYRKEWLLIKEAVLNETRLVLLFFTYKPIEFKHIESRSKEFNDNCMAYENYYYRNYKHRMWLFYDDLLLLYEGLTKTMDIDTFVDRFPSIIKITSDVGYSYKSFCRSPYVLVAILLSDKEKYDKQIRQYANTCGYFISNEYESLAEDDHTSIYVYNLEPKYIVECTNLVYNENKPSNILYHITLGKRYDKIKNNGLIPKSHNKRSKHPERIYFFLPGIYSKSDFISQARDFYKKNNKYNEEISKYMLNNDGKLDIIVLKVDLSKSDFHYKFFYDPNHPNGMFTYECINPRCVDIQYEFSI